MSDSTEHIDKPEPRWQALVALLAVGAIYLALPRSLIIGPIWLLPTLIVVLLVPTVVSHRAGKRSLNRALGIIINGITTTALIGSVILLVRWAKILAMIQIFISLSIVVLLISRAVGVL